MKESNTAMAILVVGLLGAYAWAPVYSADSGSYSQPAPGAQSGEQSQTAQTPAAAEPAEKIMPGNNSDVCARLDKNQDGFISLAEFKASGKPAKLFKNADVAKRGKLNMEECNKAMSG